MRRALLIAAIAALPAAAPPAAIAVEGLGAVQRFDAAAIAALPKAAAMIDDHGKTLNCRGAWLADLLAAAGVPAGETLRGSALAGTVTAVAQDGYRVTFSLGEIDRALGKASVLVATSCNGAALGDDGPFRLIVGGDRRPARSARMLERLVVSVDTATPDAHAH